MEEDVRTSVDVQTGNLAFDILNQIYILGLEPEILQCFKRDNFIAVTILINGSLVFCDKYKTCKYKLSFVMFKPVSHVEAVGVQTCSWVSHSLLHFYKAFWASAKSLNY